MKIKIVVDVLSVHEKSKNFWVFPNTSLVLHFPFNIIAMTYHHKNYTTINCFVRTRATNSLSQFQFH